MLIGLTGKAGSGKGVAAEYLVKKYGLKKVSFAAPLKDMLRSLGVPEGSLTGTQEQKDLPLEQFCGLSGRQLMQTLGTEWGRSLHPEFWTNALFAKYGTTGLVIDDVRFPNEAMAIHKRGGVTLMIERPGHVATMHTQHASEKSIDEIDPTFLMLNRGTLDDFYASLEEFDPDALHYLY